MLTARARLDGRTTARIYVPRDLTRAEMGWLLARSPAYRARTHRPAGTGLPERIGTKMITDVLIADPFALDLMATEPARALVLAAALADIDRWHIYPAPRQETRR